MLEAACTKRLKVSEKVGHGNNVTNPNWQNVIVATNYFQSNFWSLPWALEGGEPRPLDFKMFSKKHCFLSFELEKTNFTTFGSSHRKFLEKTLVATTGKNPSDAHEACYLLHIAHWCLWLIAHWCLRLIAPWCLRLTAHWCLLLVVHYTLMPATYCTLHIGARDLLHIAHYTGAHRCTGRHFTGGAEKICPKNKLFALKLCFIV